MIDGNRVSDKLDIITWSFKDFSVVEKQESKETRTVIKEKLVKLFLVFSSRLNYFFMNFSIGWLSSHAPQGVIFYLATPTYQTREATSRGRTSEIMLNN